MLTFDDGPSKWTPRILDLLRKHQVKATFFLIGETVLKSAWLVREMVVAGHTVGNHTYSHARLTDLDDDAVRDQLSAAQALIEVAGGVRPTVWRAPMFARDERVDRIADNLGLTHMGADVIPDDWRRETGEEIAALVLSRQPGVVCLHDGIPPGGGNGTSTRQATVDAVRLILEARP